MNAHFRKDSQRILALWFPHLPSDRIFRQRLGRFWHSAPSAASQPLIISHQENNTQRVAALSEQAEKLRLKRGMGIADARAMYPVVEIVEAEPAADRRLLESLADWCDRYTPLVALEGADGLFLDITGCAHLFGGEKAMLDDLLSRLFQQGFDVRAGLASTAGAAWAAVRFLEAGIVAPGDEGEILAPLPLSALRLDPATCASLESVGLRTAGSIMAAPRAPLVRRFGKQLLIRLDQALGRIEESLSPRLPVPSLSVERHLAEPVVLTDDIEGLAAMLAATLRKELERRDEGARTLQLALFRVDGAVQRITVGTSRPLREAALIRRLFHERLAALETDIDAGYGFELVRLSVLAASSFKMEQTDLAGEGGDNGGDLALFADRIRARLGEQAVLKPVAVESHIPERAIVTIPFAEALPEKRQAGSMKTALPSPRILTGPERPIRLFPHPEPVEVSAVEVPEGPPASFRWRRMFHQVARSEGPERIAPEWWRDEADAPTRDYFRVEDLEGRRYWLYRQGLYGASAEPPRWFMHGVFA
ncbi:MAG: DNA polymerase Y family protein [Pseudaminobacter sp.]|nr:DNA polymerase Y family protein [Pseudaminobacter sp.]